MNKKSGFFLLIIISLNIFVLIMPTSAQDSFKTTYPKAKIFLNDGRIIQGERFMMDTDTVLLHINNNPQVFMTNDVYQIMVKKGYANKFAQYFGGGCLALCGLTLIANYENLDGYYGPTVGDFIVGSLIWTAIFTGGGYLLGSLVDDWTPIYMKARVSEANHRSLASVKTDNGIKLTILYTSF